MASQRIRIPRPFVKGRVTDRPAAQLDPQEFSYGTNVVWPKGVAVKIGAWKYYTTDNVLTSNLNGIMPVQFDKTSTTVTYALASTTYIGAADTISTPIAGESASKIAGIASDYLPRAVWNGEVLYCHRTGQLPVLRWAGTVCNAPTGSKTMPRSLLTTVGSPRIEDGISPGLAIPWAYSGQFIAVLNTVGKSSTQAPQYFPATYRVTATGTYSFNVSPDSTETASSDSAYVSALGKVGLQSMVTKVGTFTSTSTFPDGPATFTGYGTQWSSTSTGTGYGQVREGDFIGPYMGGPATPYGKSYFGVVQSVAAGADTITVRNHVDTISTATQAVVTRSMTARDAVVHRGRVWFLAPEWAPNRVQVTPSNSFDLGVMHNGEESLTNDFGHAIIARYIDVPDAGAPGNIVGGVSTPGPLLILRSNNVYGIFGNWPSTNVELIYDGAGCVDIRSICSNGNVQGWCGEDGIFLYQNGKVVDITEGRISIEWRNAMRSRSVNAIVAAGMHDDHMIISVVEPSTNTATTWVYNMIAQNWCGFWTTLKAAAFGARKGLRGVSDDMFFVERVSGRVGYLDDALKDPTTISAPANYAQGAFSVTSGAALLGSITESSRVTGMKVTYELITPTFVELGTPNVIRVESGMTTTGSSGSMGIDANLTYSTTSSPMKTSVIRSSASGGIGTRGKQYQVKLTEVGDASTTERIAIHEMTIDVRKSRAESA